MPRSAEHVMIDNAFAQTDGVLRSAGSDRARTVILQTHPRRNSYENMRAWPMLDFGEHGYDTFSYNNRYTNSAAGIDVSTLWEPLALDVAAAVQEMRDRGYENVVLLGTSAGGPLVAYYQAVAECGNGLFDPERTLSGFRGFFGIDGDEQRLPAADALVFQNATTGPALSFCIRLDGSVVEESGAMREPSLDMFEPANGFDRASGTGTYDEGFLQAYQRGQAERMNRLIRSAQERLERLKAIGRPFLDDDFIVVPGVRAYPAFVDLAVAHVSRAQRALQPGHRHELIQSDRLIIPNAARDNLGRAAGATVHTLTSFLSYRAIRTDPGRYDPTAVTSEEFGVDMGSTNTSTPSNLERVTVPLLITQGTSDIEVHVPSAELNYDAANSSDKQLTFIENADHSMLDPRDAASNRTREMHLDVVAGWLETRFAH
jgi:alpha-beta hydrolase superfamily lysophospholipase